MVLQVKAVVCLHSTDHHSSPSTMQLRLHHSPLMYYTASECFLLGRLLHVTQHAFTMRVRAAGVCHY
jgi:hypothetical protein